MKNVNEMGRSMVEMLGVLAVIGVLSVGGIIGFQKATERYKINKTISQITHIATNARTLFMKQGTYDGLNLNNKSTVNGESVPDLKRMNIVPEEMWKRVTANVAEPTYILQNAWSEDVTMEQTTRRAGDIEAKAFSITYKNVPDEACIELISQDWRNAQVKMISVYNMHIYARVLPPADPDTATKICDSGDGWQDIGFFFDIYPTAEPWKTLISQSQEAINNL